MVELLGITRMVFKMVEEVLGINNCSLEIDGSPRWRLLKFWLILDVGGRRNQGGCKIGATRKGKSHKEQHGEGGRSRLAPLMVLLTMVV